MERSFAARARGAIERGRLRWVYERLRLELSVADVLTRVDPAHSITDNDTNPPFSRLLEAHLQSTPRALWDAAEPPAHDAIERVRAGEWDLLGRTLSVTPSTDWHRDPIFGARWPRRYVGALSFYSQGGDVVTLWHLNKMMFLLDLAGAYRATRDPELADRVYAIIDSWCIANPFLIGINWASPLDIATRLAVWSQALAAIADAPLPSEERAARILRSVVRQADHVASHLSQWPIPNNHLMGEVAMLFVFGAYWPVWKDSQAWMAHAEEILVGEVERQVLADGVQYEASVNYHAYALDFVLLYLHAKAVRGETPPATVLERARAMAIAHLELAMPSGRYPRIGDDTIDRFFVLSQGVDAPALSLHASVFEDALRIPYARVFAVTQWGRDLLALQVPTVHARHFAEAGISVVRDPDAAVVFVHGPQHRHLFSHGHLHADAGSFELELGGVPVVVDAGTYAYFVDPEARTYFKGARAHNAPVVDEVESMRSLEPFRWESVATGEYLGFGAAPGAVGVGNRRKLQGADGVQMQHTRALVVSHGTVLVLDAIRTRDQAPVSQTHIARIVFRTPTPPGTAVCEGTRVSVTDPRRFVRVFEAFADQKIRVDAVDDPLDRTCWYSPRYGDLKTGVAVRVSAEFESRVVILSAIRNTEVAVNPLRLDGADALVAIESHGTRRLVRVRFDPFEIVVGGRTLVGRGADVAGIVNPRGAAKQGAATPDWLDELSL